MTALSVIARARCGVSRDPAVTSIYVSVLTYCMVRGNIARESTLTRHSAASTTCDDGTAVRAVLCYVVLLLSTVYL